MRSSSLDNLLDDNNIQNHFFFNFTNLSIIFKDKQKQSSRNTNRWVPFVRICNYVSKRTIHYHINDSQTIYSVSPHEIETFQDDFIYCLAVRAIFIHCLSFPPLEQAFRRYCVDPFIRSDADRWGYR